MIKKITPEQFLTQYNSFKRNANAIEGIFGKPKQLKNIYIPPGEFELTETLIITEPIVISGAGTDVSTLIYNGNGPAIIFSYEGNAKKAGIKNLKIISTDSKIDTAGVSVNNGNMFFLENVEIAGFSNDFGLYMYNNCKNCLIHNTNITNNSLGIEAANIQGLQLNNVILNNSLGNLLAYDFNNLSWNGGGSFGNPSSFGIRLSDGHSVSFENLEHNLERANVFAIEAVGDDQEAISIKNCFFNITNSPRKLIKLNNTNYSTISNCKSSLSGGDVALELNNSNSISINIQRDFHSDSEFIQRNDDSNIIWTDGTTQGVDPELATFSSFTVLDVTKDLTKLGFEANAVRNVTGGGDPIQDAIDYFIANGEEFYAIWIPTGVYSLTKPLVLGINNGLTRVVMIGAPRAFTIITSFGGTVLRYDGDGSGNEKVTPMVIIQGARSTHIQGINFLSKGNNKPFELLSVANNNYNMFNNMEVENWIDDGVRTNDKSPQCVICIDPFINTSPDGDPNNRYPGFEDYYGVTWTNPATSSDIHFDGCVFWGGYVGVAVSPANSQNAENFEFKDCFWVYNTVHFSQGQSQSRANNIHNCKMYGAWLCIDDNYVGIGGNAGINPLFSGAVNIGGCVYIFNLNMSTNQFHMQNAHFESFISLGRVGYGASAVNLGAVFTACLFNFLSPDNNAISENAPHVAYHIGTYGYVVFNRCVFTASGAEHTNRFWNKTGKIVFRECSFSDANRNGRIRAGFESESIVTIENLHTRNSLGAVYTESPLSSISRRNVNGGSTVILTQDATVLSQATFNINDTSDLGVGDLIHVKSTGAPYVPPKLHSSQFGYGYFGPIGYISNIVENTSVTIKGLPANIPYGTNLLLEVSTWLNE